MGYRLFPPTSPHTKKEEVILIKQSMNNAITKQETTFLNIYINNVEFGKYEIRKCNFVCLVLFLVYVDVLSFSMSFNVRFCKYEHISIIV